MLSEHDELESGEAEISLLILLFSGLATELGVQEFKSDDLTTSSDKFLDKLMSERSATASPVLPLNGSDADFSDREAELC